MSKLYANGYVHSLIDDNLSFKDFMLRCARGFGALITMRDEPMDAPIPDTFEDNYYANSVSNAEQTVANLKAMTDAEKLAYGETKKNEAVEAAIQSVVEYRREYQKAWDTLDQVRAWAPPSSDHIEYKNQVIKWLTDSLDGYKFYDTLIEEAQAKDPITFYNDALKTAERDIVYYKEEAVKEADRNANRSAWVQQLKASLA